MIKMPVVTIPANITRSLIFTTFLSKIIDGNDSAVTAIMNANAVPIPTPLRTSASAIGSVPKISAYIGTPTSVASGTDHQLFWPIRALISSAGIQLWMAAPMPTPIRIYSHTRWMMSVTCWRA